jgi:hypothetical protein
MNALHSSLSRKRGSPQLPQRGDSTLSDIRRYS